MKPDFRVLDPEERGGPDDDELEGLEKGSRAPQSAERARRLCGLS